MIEGKLQKKKLYRFSATKLIFLCVITTIISISVTVSKYKASATLQDATRVAIMANNLTFSLEDYISGYPGCTEVIYPIVLTNKENEKVCEVSQKYTIKVKRLEEENLPLQFDLYEDRECTRKLQKSDNETYVNDDFSFDAGNEEEKTYYLKVSWPSEKNSANYAFEIDYFKLNIAITQID